MNSGSLGLPRLLAPTFQLREYYTVPPPCLETRQPAWTITWLTWFYVHFSRITVLCCLMSNVFQVVVACIYICHLFFFFLSSFLLPPSLPPTLLVAPSVWVTVGCISGGECQEQWECRCLHSSSSQAHSNASFQWIHGFHCSPFVCSLLTLSPPDLQLGFDLQAFKCSLPFCELGLPSPIPFPSQHDPMTALELRASGKHPQCFHLVLLLGTVPALQSPALDASFSPSSLLLIITGRKHPWPCPSPTPNTVASTPQFPLAFLCLS